MSMPGFPALDAFVAVARHRSFRKAALQRGVSPSALSHVIRGLEQTLGVRLFNRTNRSVSITAAGERLLARIGPRAGRHRRSGRGDRPSEGEAERAAAPERAAQRGRDRHQTAHGPLPGGLSGGEAGGRHQRRARGHRGRRLRRRHPGHGAAGADHGHGSDRAAAALRRRRLPGLSRPDGRAPHARRPAVPCLHRAPLPERGPYAWTFARNGEAVDVAVAGTLVADDRALIISAALDGIGLAYIHEALVRDHLARGALVRVLEEWCPPLPPFQLYFPSRRMSAPLRAFVDMVRAGTAIG